MRQKGPFSSAFSPSHIYTSGGIIPAEDHSFEGGTVGTWHANSFFNNFINGSLSNSSVRAYTGTKSLLVTWPATTQGSWAPMTVSGLVTGRAYTMSFYVFVPTGHADVKLSSVFGVNSSYTTVKNTWTRVSGTWTPDPGFENQNVGIYAAIASAGDQVWVDNVQCFQAYE